ncbi:Na+/H+ antiporter NhaA [Caminibacter mediatlanticus]|uniref:Na(+)/H(+) antiporter NhaA n=1 Tax=Caminibacter mediatlanticus TB-2 TaxID=391592 RepID=A0AAI9AG17_9BACT|nr:Na+/H+ antiporter NhaA [Caminibacter mediatlanticus]EDM22963.1 Na+/H+ antiporter NhaA [Caminibacter mediatlanticus TB-2]
MRLRAPWERFYEKITTPFEAFLKAQTATGIVLAVFTVIALILANSPVSEYYFHFFHSKFGFVFENFKFSMSLHHWINDALMAIFFFLIGLEIKREILIGELSKIKVAILPILAAIGGMVFPALIYYMINKGTPAEIGWGIPMATDIAFAISALVLLGNKVPKSLFTFLVALAIVDDLGAVIVIALFYTSEINFLYLELALMTFFVLVIFNRLGIRAVLPYFIVGTILWAFMLKSGIHATIAGVLAALAIPSIPQRNVKFLSKVINRLLQRFERENNSSHMSDKQISILFKIQKYIDSVIPPAEKLEHILQMPVSLIVIPLFALANAGVVISSESIMSVFSNNVSLGIILGLVVGKVVGIFGVSFVAIKLRVASLPKGSSFSQLFGVAFLGGIGFTMSIFITELAFYGNMEMISQAKMAILLASLFAGLFGFLWLRFVTKKG